MCDASQTPVMQISNKILTLLISCSIITGCATEKYQAKPISVDKTTLKILSKDPYSPDFLDYLNKQGYQETNILHREWGVDELTLCALYFHPKLEVTKAQLGLAIAQVKSASQKQSPTLTGSLAHSDLSNGDKRPWAYGLNIEIPIETTNKSEVRLEEAEANVEAARMDIADTAWQLRSDITKTLIALEQNFSNIELLQEKLANQDETYNMLQKRLDKGLASKTELSIVQFAQLKTQSEINISKAHSEEIEAVLASNVGLSLDKFKQINLKPLNIDDTLAQKISILDTNFVNKSLQETTLLNRIDIRRSLAKYKAAEAKVKLEIAKQIPDISLSPGIAFEYGDSIWSLGFSALLGLTNKMQIQIEEAKQLREVEGLQFEALQSQIISDLSQAYTNYASNKAKLDQTIIQQKNQSQQFQKLQKQFDAGLIDRLELKQAKLNNIILQQQVSEAKFELLKATNNIEDVMQHPIYNSFELPNLITPN
jgi:cobalt-zinc-cadmium efflux system outer membrane protein